MGSPEATAERNLQEIPFYEDFNPLQPNLKLQEYLACNEEALIPGEKLLLFAEARRSLGNEFSRTLTWEKTEEIEVHGGTRTVQSATMSVREFVNFVKGRTFAGLSMKDNTGIVQKALTQAYSFPPEISKDIIGEIMNGEPYTFWGRINSRFEEKRITLNEQMRTQLRLLNATVMALPEDILHEVKQRTKKIITADELVDKHGMGDYEIGLATDIEGFVPLGDLDWGEFCAEGRELAERTLQEEFAMGWTSYTNRQMKTRHAGFSSLLKDLMETHGNMLSPKARILLKMHHVPGFPGARLKKEKEDWKTLIRKVGPAKSAEFLNTLIHAGLSTKYFLAGLTAGISSLNPRACFKIGHSYSGERVRIQSSELPVIGYIMNPASLPTTHEVTDKYQQRFKVISTFLQLASKVPIPPIVKDYFTGKISIPLMGPKDPKNVAPTSQYPNIADELTREHTEILEGIPIKTIAAVLASMIRGVSDSVGVANPMLTSTKDFLTHPNTIRTNLATTGKAIETGLQTINFYVDTGDVIEVLTDLELKGGHMEWLDPANRKHWLESALTHFLRVNNQRYMNTASRYIHSIKGCWSDPIFTPEKLRYLSQIKEVLLCLAEHEFDKIPKQLIELQNQNEPGDGDILRQIHEKLDSLSTELEGKISPSMHEKIFGKKNNFGSLASVTFYFGFHELRNDILEGVKYLHSGSIDQLGLTTLIDWVGGLRFFFMLYAKKTEGQFDEHRCQFLTSTQNDEAWKALVGLIEQVRLQPEAPLIPKTENELMALLNIGMTRMSIDKRVDEFFHWCYQKGAAQTLSFHQISSFRNLLTDGELDDAIQRIGKGIIMDRELLKLIETEFQVREVFTLSANEFHTEFESRNTVIVEAKTLWRRHIDELSTMVNEQLKNKQLSPDQIDKIKSQILEWAEEILFYTTKTYLQLSARIPSINQEALLGRKT